MKRHAGVSTFERLEALIACDELYDLGDAVPTPDPTAGGRPRMYPTYMWVLYDALVSVWGSARRVEVELSHPLVWGELRRLVAARFPDDPDRWLPEEPMRRWHYLYGRNRWLTDPEVFARLQAIHRHAAIGQARAIGLLDPDGPGSWTHPDLSRMVYADGKVITPLFRARPETRVLDKATGEIRTPRFEADAGLHFEGTGETAWGTKWVIAAVRTTDVHGRVILDVDWVPTPGGEAKTAMATFAHLADQAPGLQGVIYDTALRGVHHQQLLRQMGLLPVNKVTAAEGTGPRTKGKKRREKSTYVETRTIETADGTTHTLDLFAQGGAIGITTLTDGGNRTFTPLKRIRTTRHRDKVGTYRWYNHHRLPHQLGGGELTVRLHGNDDDKARRLNRTENVRPIPQTDPDFAGLYKRRNDAESITAPSTTPCGSAAPTPSATAASTSTSSPTPSASTPSPCTATDGPAATHPSPPPPDRRPTGRHGGFDAPRHHLEVTVEPRSRRQTDGRPLRSASDAGQPRPTEVFVRESRRPRAVSSTGRASGF